MNLSEKITSFFPNEGVVSKIFLCDRKNQRKNNYNFVVIKYALNLDFFSPRIFLLLIKHAKQKEKNHMTEILFSRAYLLTTKYLKIYFIDICQGNVFHNDA